NRTASAPFPKSDQGRTLAGSEQVDPVGFQRAPIVEGPRVAKVACLAQADGQLERISEAQSQLPIRITHRHPGRSRAREPMPLRPRLLDAQDESRPLRPTDGI